MVTTLIQRKRKIGWFVLALFLSDCSVRHV